MRLCFQTLLIAVSVALLSACSQMPSLEVVDAPTVEAAPAPPEVTPEPTLNEVLESPPEPANLWLYIGQQSTWRAPERAQSDVGKARERWLSQNGLFNALGERASPALQYIVAEIERRGLPVELALIPILESTLNPWAYSSQHAAGLWQINPPTANHYKLTRDWWYDARYDIPTATRTALDYLTELNIRFKGDWWLTLAAYNAGPGRVERAVRRAAKAGESTAYWDLKLPPQTRGFIPKLLGLLSLLHAEGYDADKWPDTPIRASWVAVETGGQIELARAASLAGMDEEDLRRMNPGHLRWATSPEANTSLWVPDDKAAALQAGLATLSPDERVQWNRYEIVPGDSLIRIARRFDSQVNLIREVNGLSGNLIRAGDELLIPKGGNWSQSLKLARRNRVASNSRPRNHKVRKGDSLWRIARRYDLTVETLVRWNRLSADAYLQPGQTLRLRP